MEKASHAGSGNEPRMDIADVLEATQLALACVRTIEAWLPESQVDDPDLFDSIAQVFLARKQFKAFQRFSILSTNRQFVGPLEIVAHWSALC